MRHQQPRGNDARLVRGILRHVLLHRRIQVDGAGLVKFQQSHTGDDGRGAEARLERYGHLMFEVGQHAGEGEDHFSLAHYGRRVPNVLVPLVDRLDGLSARVVFHSSDNGGLLHRRLAAERE